MAQERHRCTSESDRVRDMLQHHRLPEAAADQALPDVQESVPLKLPHEVVQDEQRKHVSVVSQHVQLQLGKAVSH